MLWISYMCLSDNVYFDYEECRAPIDYMSPLYVERREPDSTVGFRFSDKSNLDFGIRSV